MWEQCQKQYHATPLIASLREDSGTAQCPITVSLRLPPLTRAPAAARCTRSRIASTHGDHNIYVTDVASGALLNTLRGHPRSPWCVAFHPTNSQLIASGCLGGEVRVWDLHVSGQRLRADTGP